MTEDLGAQDVLDAYRDHSDSLSDEDWSGLDAISNLRGPFALLIHDASTERIIASRDREVGYHYAHVPYYLLDIFLRSTCICNDPCMGLYTVAS